MTQGVLATTEPAEPVEHARARPRAPEIVPGRDALVRALGSEGAARVIPPWRDGSPDPHYREVEVVARVLVDVPVGLAVDVVQDIGGIDLYERKVDAVNVEPYTESSGEYYLEGRLAAVVPWEGAFTYELHAGGFHSKTARGPVAHGVDVTGGFHVINGRPDGAVVVHYEHYLLPPKLGWATGLHRAYTRRSMKVELTDISRMLRLLQRRVTARE